MEVNRGQIIRFFPTNSTSYVLYTVCVTFDMDKHIDMYIKEAKSDKTIPEHVRKRKDFTPSTFYMINKMVAADLIRKFDLTMCTDVHLLETVREKIGIKS